MTRMVGRENLFHDRLYSMVLPTLLHISCNPVIVIAEGSVLFQGTSDEVKKDEKVIESYLGRGSKLKDKN